MALVDELTLALLQLGSEPPELALILAQQCALVHILIHPRSVADVLGPVGKLQSAQGLCSRKRKDKAMPLGMIPEKLMVNPTLLCLHLVTSNSVWYKLGS